MKLRYLLPLLFCALSTFTGQALAYNCHFTENKTITLPDFWTVNSLIGVSGGFTQPVEITNGASGTTALLFPGMSNMILCPTYQVGNDNVVELSPPDASMMDSYTTTYHNGEIVGLLKTSVPGIVYTYEVRCSNNCASGNQLYLSLPPKGKTSKSTSFNGGYQESEPNWDVFFTLYQTPEYRPHPGQTQVQAIAGTIGSLKMGTSSSNKITINVSNGSVLFTLAEPTCQTAGINGSASTRFVDFGDFYASDFSTSDVTEKRNFTFDLFGCSMNKISLTVNGPHDGSGNYLTNSKGTAEGIGVQLAAQFNNVWNPVKFDGTPIGADHSGNSDWWYETYSIPFTGQLKKLGTIKVGTFESEATFTLSYE
ncbi:TPA: fimbrial protein [Citrobacter freundii]|uniref:fimbrial protein n=1 Tax=Citrobacter freundii TaxID=546 RepID=UPI00397BB09B|nr:fimbrial protein [Citrobacter freundii]